MWTIRSGSKNMCSVRLSPIPSAPNLSAVSASVGVSALARTPMVRTSSAHSIRVAKSPVSSGWIIATSPFITSPVEPSTVITSPSESSTPIATRILALTSTLSSPAPDTQGMPMPRATTAAWDVMPPRVVRIPSETCMPPMSSGEVSILTRITFSSRPAQASASAALKTILPVAAPGLAGRPRPSRSRSALGSRVGCRSWSNCPASIRWIAWFLSIRPSATMSTAILSAALVVRLPARVCSIHSFPRSTVNSMSCMSV